MFNHILNRFVAFSIFFVFLFAENILLASPLYTTYSAKIVMANGSPLENTQVDFKFTVMNPGQNCSLYSERFTAINMFGSNGYIALTLGSGVREYPLSGVMQFADAFKNSGSFSCQEGSTYSPSSVSSRNIIMQFFDGSRWQTASAMQVNGVPYASYATLADSATSATTASNALALNGKLDTDFVVKPVTCTTNQILSYNGSTFTCVNNSGGGGSGLNSITSGSSSLIIGGTASAPVLSLTTATASSAGVLSAADYTRFDAAATASTAASSSVVVNTIVKRDSSGNSSFNGVTTSTLSANATSVNSLDIYKASTSNYVRLQAPVGLSSSYVLSLPVSAGVSGQVLQTDGSGNLSWLGLGSLAQQSSVNLGTQVTGTLAATSLASSGVTSGTYGSNNAVPTISVDIYGRITSVTSNAYQYADTINYGILRVPSGSNLTVSSGSISMTASNVISALGYTPAVSGSSSSSQWATSGSTINYTSGNVGIGTTTPEAQLTVSGGSVLFRGNGGTPTSGIGTRMMWIPGKAAFRAGFVGDTWYSGDDWDDNMIGWGSVAMGANVVATGSSSVVMGWKNRNDWGARSVLFGSYSTTSGDGAVAIGSYNSSVANGAITLGNANGAYGSSSVVIGNESVVNGDQSSAFGWGLKSEAYGQVSLGRYNQITGTETANSWVAVDPVLVIGNGVSDTSRSNAVMILKNGNVGLGENNPSVKLQVNGAIAGNTNIIAAGGSIDLSLSNTHILQNIGGNTLALSNMVNGGVYTLIIQDQTSRLYSFSGCANSRFSPALAATTASSDTVFGITTVQVGGSWYCYITWSSGFQ